MGDLFQLLGDMIASIDEDELGDITAVLGNSLQSLGGFLGLDPESIDINAVIALIGNILQVLGGLGIIAEKRRASP